MWGGSDTINRFVDEWVGDRLKTQFDITLNRIPLNDTVEAVNKVIGEVQAGLTQGGSIDLIWINGENFRTLKQGNLLYGPFTDHLPSMEFYDPDNAAVFMDFGLPTDGYEAPFTGSYFVMAKDRSRVALTPQSFAEILEWAKANPGRFAYVAPPAFDGSRFLLTVLYGVTGGYEQYAGPVFNEDLWNQNSPMVLEYLRELHPFLWRAGTSFPPSQTRIHDMFANGEIWMLPIFVSRVAEGITSGLFPTTTTAFSLPGISLNDPSFTAIPINAGNPTGAMILADLLASPDGQLQKFMPDVWGDPPLISVHRLPSSLQAQFQTVEDDYGLPLQQITTQTVPVVHPQYTTRLEQLWNDYITS
jgi:putative spermidine/putrescine transport system substrate-binding protein